MVLPGSVYPKEIKRGEKVSGRAAEVALQLGKGVDLDVADSEPDDKDELDNAESASTEPETKAAATVPETKASLFSEAEKAEKGCKACQGREG